MDLRLTDTNAADDAPGRVFGLDGNLYLPVVGSAVGGVGLFAFLAYGLGLNVLSAGMIGLAPFAVVLAWALVLKRGKPAGYDRDKLDDLVGARGFGPASTSQGEVSS